MKKKTILLLSVFLMFGCNTDNIPTKQTTSLNALEKSNIKTIKGQVQFPKTGFSIKSKFEDVAKDTTVSLIYPSDHATNANKIISTGLTDSTGLFTLNPDFNPTDNEIFVLEAVKRTGGAGNSVMTIRTHLKWSNSTGWSSITGSDVYINNHTTALAIIDGYDNTISSYDTIGKVSMSRGVPVASSVGGVTSSTINEVSTLVDSVLYASKDPFAVIKFVNGTYQIDHSKDIEQLTLNNNCSGCSLVGMNLSNISLAGKDLSYADLRGLNLANQDLSETILIGADLRGATLPDDLSYLDLSEVKLTGNDLRLSTDNTKIKKLKGTNFSYADMTEINLSGTDANNMADLSETRLKNCNFSKGNLSFTNSQKVNYYGANFTNTKIYDSNFSNSDLTNVDLSLSWQDASIKAFRNINLTGANLTGTNFTGQDLTVMTAKNLSKSTKTILKGAIFNNANLAAIDLRGQDLTGIKAKSCNFSTGAMYSTALLDANLTNADFSDSNLSYCNLNDLNFSNLDMRRANLRFSSLVGTNFSGAILHSADLRAQVLDRCNFSSADLRNTQLKTVMSNSDFSYANMSGLILYSNTFNKTIFGNGCKFLGTNFKDVVFSDGSNGTKFTDSDLTGVNISGTEGSIRDIRGMDFSNSNLTQANLSYTFAQLNSQGSNLTKFYKTMLVGADLSHSNYSGANFNLAIFYKSDMPYTATNLTYGQFAGTNFSSSIGTVSTARSNSSLVGAIWTTGQVCQALPPGQPSGSGVCYINGVSY